jgi:hypothetical protein
MSSTLRAWGRLDPVKAWFVEAEARPVPTRSGSRT